jgi:hypothetical protein
MTAAESRRLNRILAEKPTRSCQGWHRGIQTLGPCPRGYRFVRRFDDVWACVDAAPEEFLNWVRSAIHAAVPDFADEVRGLTQVWPLLTVQQKRAFFTKSATWLAPSRVTVMRQWLETRAREAA